jgi:hypothetical protein
MLHVQDAGSRESRAGFSKVISKANRINRVLAIGANSRLLRITALANLLQGKNNPISQ